ncbi:MAG: iron uptake porin [Cyanobacteria bacterium]|nr:iron uptake porin [Cyanobacteriota bacterium]
MTFKRMTPMLLAASVFLTGATGAFLGAMTPVHALASVDELSDVDRNHWAYEALRDLVEKYDVIEGYPDKTFRGNKQPTRWELAAALNALMKSVGRDLARLGAEKANKADLETLARLQDEFRNELNALKARTNALEARATALESKNSEQDNRLALLEKTQLHGDASIGILNDISRNGLRSPGGVSSAGQRDGILDGMSVVGRLRLNMDVPLKEDSDEDKVFGAGTLHTRLIAAFGRVSPSGGAGGNGGATSPFSGYSRIAGDASASNEGIGTLTNGGLSRGGNLRTSVYVEQMYYEQHLKSGVLGLTDNLVGAVPSSITNSGDIYAGVIPWRNLFDTSPYRGNELTQFQNYSFVNTPGIQVNYNMPMIAYRSNWGINDDTSFHITAGIGTINTGDALDGWNLTYEARLNYKTKALGLLGNNEAKPGSLYVGGYDLWENGNTLRTALGTGTPISGGLNSSLALNSSDPRRRSSLYSLYLGFNQELFSGIGLSANYMLSNNSGANYVSSSLNQGTGANANRILNSGNAYVAPRQAGSVVLNIPMKAFGWREKDVIGLGYAWVSLQKGGRGLTSGTFQNQGVEHVIESYYRYQFNDSISFVPSFQVIANRQGYKANGAVYVFGFRTNYQF